MITTTVNSIYDGDTVRVNIDLGLHFVMQDESIRLLGLDAPEVTGISKVQGQAAREYLVNLLTGSEVMLQTDADKRDKYGRILATFFVKGKGDWCPVSEWCSVNQQMITAGHAKPYDGGTR